MFDEAYCCAAQHCMAQHGTALEVAITTGTIIRLCRDLYLCTEYSKQAVKFFVVVPRTRVQS
jgi:hypothetical protein